MQGVEFVQVFWSAQNRAAAGVRLAMGEDSGDFRSAMFQNS